MLICETNAREKLFGTRGKILSLLRALAWRLAAFLLAILWMSSASAVDCIQPPDHLLAKYREARFEEGFYLTFVPTGRICESRVVVRPLDRGMAQTCSIILRERGLGKSSGPFEIQIDYWCLKRLHDLVTKTSKTGAAEPRSDSAGKEFENLLGSSCKISINKLSESTDMFGLEQKWRKKEREEVIKSILDAVTIPFFLIVIFVISIRWFTQLIKGFTSGNVRYRILVLPLLIQGGILMLAFGMLSDPYETHWRLPACAIILIALIGFIAEVFGSIRQVRERRAHP